MRVGKRLRCGRTPGGDRVIRLDGSLHSGSGTLLRYAAALATLTKTPIHMVRIRSRRPRPGLRAQHLQALRACASLCSGQLEGDEVVPRKSVTDPDHLEGEISSGSVGHRRIHHHDRVRLKDFYELLAKTGLSERTYTIIGQGLVDLALSIRPDERSKLFEEAAGIGLYRTRKEEALKRLEATRRNLERAQDILDEIKPRLRNLERQAVRAREYLTIQDNLQNKLRLWYGYHWYKAQEEFAGAKAQLNTAQEARDKIQARVDTIHVEVGDLKEKLTTERDEVGRLHEQLGAFHNQVQAKNQQIAILEERERSLNREKDQLEKDLSIVLETIESEQKASM